MIVTVAVTERAAAVMETTETAAAVAALNGGSGSGIEWWQR
jgi:hypothetical protein